MFKGQFIRGDGLVIPNNVTTYGIHTLLASALRGQPSGFFIGLCSANPVPNLLLEDLNEPTIGVSGYNRQPVPADNSGWPIDDSINGDIFFETKAVTFGILPDDIYDKPVSRLFLCDTELAIAGLGVMALSQPFEQTKISDETPVEQRTFKYRLYGR